MKAQKTIDTYYPNYYHSSWLDFEQKHLLGWQVTPQDAKDYSFAHSYNEWFASKYSFRNSHLAISQGYGAVGIQWHIGGGCYVITNAQDAQKAEHGIELNSKDHLYLVFAYRHKDLWDGRPLMPRIKAFIQYLEQMPANPIETIYTRATDVNGIEKKHLRLTGMLPSKNATDATLDRVYRKYFGVKVSLAWLRIPFFAHRIVPSKIFTKLTILCPNYVHFWSKSGNTCQSLSKQTPFK